MQQIDSKTKLYDRLFYAVLAIGFLIVLSTYKDYGITLLVIEHNMKVIMSLAQKIFCLAHGKMLAEGSPNQIKNDKRVVDAYLGAQ